MSCKDDLQNLSVAFDMFREDITDEDTYIVELSTPLAVSRSRVPEQWVTLLRTWHSCCGISSLDPFPLILCGVAVLGRLKAAFPP